MTGTAKEVIEYLRLLNPDTQVNITVTQTSTYQSTGDFRDAPRELYR